MLASVGRPLLRTGEWRSRINLVLPIRAAAPATSHISTKAILGVLMIDPVQALLLALCVLIFASDLYARRVPNRWLGCALALGGGWMLAGWLAGHSSFPSSALLSLAAGLVTLLPFYIVGWMGAGDVKFFGVLGFLLGWRMLLPLWVVASLLGGAYISVSMLAHRFGWHAALHAQTHLAGQAWWRRLADARQDRQGTPYAACLSAAAILILLSGHGHHV